MAVAGRSDALIEAGDLFRFNGLRGQYVAYGPDARYKVLELDVFGRVWLAWSPDGDTRWLRQDIPVAFTEAMALIDANVWELQPSG